ncbi:MAG TPA: efflux RND transporter periplasmic adaptor subunit [Candidatus Saccharimonadia bacterium]|nr:efflux RND transporter periplasmic adaptor subunit [Candidatus Saccharimonadia bacterium]
MNRLVRAAGISGIVFTALILLGCGGKPDGKGDAEADGKAEDAVQETPIPVEVGTAASRPIVASYTGTVTLEPERQAQVVAKTSGVLLRLHVEEGDRVKSGQLLAELDPDKPRLELARASANLRRLESDYRRSTELNARQLVSPEAHDRVKFDLETQAASHEIAKLDLSYTRIVAPIDGVISERMVKEGNLIQLHTALFRIDDFDPLHGVLNVPERELTTLKPGLPVKMHVDALPAHPFTGTVARVSPVVDPATGTFRVTTEFHDPTGTIKSGMFGRIDIVHDERADALTIPREALIEEDGETSVFLVEIDTSPPPKPKPEDEKRAKKGEANAADAKKPPATRYVARRKTVVAGYASGDVVEIREGLAEGDKVVTVGRAAVRDGTKVQLVDAPQ